MASKKKIHRNDITGERGVNLIQRVVLEMGCLWYATGGVEAGIDGFIEIRDPATGEVTNSIVQVQSKATSGRFQAETEAGFDYLCDERDIDYWLNGNAPVVLVVSRPDSDEAYWASVKDHFKDLNARKSRKIHFVKQRDRFDTDARPELVRLAIPRDSGVYLAPPPKKELVHSNLLGVSCYPRRIYQARTDFRSGRDFGPALRDRCDRPRGEWVLTDKSVLSFHDLAEEPWRSLCDRGTLERFDSDDFAFSNDKEKNWAFTRLLGECLKAMLWHIHVRFDLKMRHYYFRSTKDCSPRVVKYYSLQKNTSRTVFSPRFNSADPSRAIYYRHAAFEGPFRRHDEGWYLEITPTYRYTLDGLQILPNYEKHLKGMKRLETNAAVLGQVVMWANLLGRHRELFAGCDPLLEFGELKTFEINSGIVDEAWLKHESEPPEVGPDGEALTEEL